MKKQSKKMQLQIHLPRNSEADIHPPQNEDIIITPKFYKKTGWVPILYFTTTDSRGREEKHALYISAANKTVRVDKLVEVIPACDDLSIEVSPVTIEVNDPGEPDATSDVPSSNSA